MTRQRRDYVMPRRDYTTVITVADFMDACARRDAIRPTLPAYHTVRVVNGVAGGYAVQVGVPRNGAAGPVARWSR